MADKQRNTEDFGKSNIFKNSYQLQKLTSIVGLLVRGKKQRSIVLLSTRCLQHEAAKRTDNKTLSLICKFSLSSFCFVIILLFRGEKSLPIILSSF